MARLGDKTYYRGVHPRSFSSNISRTATSAAELFVLPAGASIKQITIIGAKSDAGTSAKLSLGSNGGTGKEFLADFNVKANGVVSYPSSFGAFVGQSDPNPITITGTYAEDGASSTVGGPWTVVVDLF
jgi:hypothetical protein